MTRAEFEQRLADLRRRISDLPPSQREALEALARETLERHEEIRRSSLESRRSVERLELAWERLQAACHRLRGVALEAGRAIEAAREGSRPAPGTN